MRAGTNHVLIHKQQNEDLGPKRFLYVITGEKKQFTFCIIKCFNLCSSFMSLLHNGTVDLSFKSGRNEVVHTCKRNILEDLAVVEVRMAGSVYERSQIRLKQTLADKVSGFGEYNHQTLNYTTYISSDI